MEAHRSKQGVKLSFVAQAEIGLRKEELLYFDVLRAFTGALLRAGSFADGVMYGSNCLDRLANALCYASEASPFMYFPCNVLGVEARIVGMVNSRSATVLLHCPIR